MTPEELKEIEDRCNKATPGPWKACHEGVCSCSQVWSQSADVPVAEVARGEWGDPGFPYGEIPEKISETNSLFIAHAREDIPKLLSYIKELKSQIPRWIPVEERLPEKEGIYLVFEPWVYGVNALWFVLGMDGLPNSTTKKAWETVSHWKSLPKGPEE